eukprot:16437956-Heterocapsa_arctica.AAC.1
MQMRLKDTSKNEQIRQIHAFGLCRVPVPSVQYILHIPPIPRAPSRALVRARRLGIGLLSFAIDTFDLPADR